MIVAVVVVVVVAAVAYQRGQAAIHVFSSAEYFLIERSANLIASEIEQRGRIGGEVAKPFVRG